MARILVVQLARMGDLVQSLYLCRDLKEAEGHEVSILADARHLALIRRLAPGLNVYPVPGEDGLQGFRQGDSWARLWESSSREHGLPGKASFDRVIHLNAGRCSGALSSHGVEPGCLGGIGPAEDARRADPWADLFSRLVRNPRRWNRFHRVDAYRSYAGRRLPPLDRKPRPRDRFAGGTVGIDLAAPSCKQTGWEHALPAVVRHLQQEADMEILLLGDAREQEGADKVLRATGGRRVRHLVGSRMSPSDLVDAVEACDTLLSADTGVLHLAAWLGVPTVALFFGPAVGFETGPYGRGHTLLQTETAGSACRQDAPCGTPSCGLKLRPADVLPLLCGERPPLRDGLRVYTSVFVDRWMQYLPVHRCTATRDDLLGFLYLSSLGEVLEAGPGRFPPRETALGFLVAGYRLDDPACFPDPAGLDATLPMGLPLQARHRLRTVLRQNLARLEAICHAAFSSQPLRGEREAAGRCASA